MKNVKPKILSCIRKKTIVLLIHGPNSEILVFGEHLTPLRSCGTSSLAVGLDENECKTRLVCLSLCKYQTHAGWQHGLM